MKKNLGVFAIEGERNDVLLQAICKRYSSIHSFCESHRLDAWSETKIAKLIRLKQSPFLRSGEYSSFSFQLGSILDVSLENLFPAELYRKVNRRRRKLRFSLFSNLSRDIQTQIAEIPDKDSDPEKIFLDKELRLNLISILEKMDGRDRMILKLRLGFYNYSSHSLRDVGKIFKLTKSRVQQIEQNLFEELRRHPKLLELMT